MKTLRNIVLIMLAIVAFCVWTDPANAQSREVRSLLTDRGWHGVGEGIQVHQPTIEFKAPWVSVWERAPRPPRPGVPPYGDWTHVKVLVNCEQRTHIPIATLDNDWNVVYLEDLTGEPPVARWPEPGSVPERTITALCALYGYTRRPLTPTLRPNPGGEPYVGGIQRLDKP